MNTWIVLIDGWHPTRLNQLLGHWAKAARLKKADRDVIALACRAAGVPPATGKRRVSIELVLAPRQRGPDPDAFFKTVFDGLTACGALINDNRQHLELGPVTYSRGDRKATRIVLEDLAPANPVSPQPRPQGE